ncbi:hypothetical protein [Pricia sp.]|uniref:hypothetical protein n=1 Tax=Pricia sp. TaxID=2268138 RepID=UPI003593CBBC
MKRIILTQLEHRGAQQMGIQFDYEDEVRHYVKELSGIKWSQTYKTFYVPLNTQNKNIVFRHLRKKKWYIDYSALQGKQAAAPKKVLPPSTKRVITDDNKALVRQYVSYLRGLRLSERNIPLAPIAN